MKSVLVRCFGFMGDVLYASSLAKKLKEEGFDRVVYLCGIPQVVGILSRNPHINEVFITRTPTNNTHQLEVREKFDTEIFIPECFFVDTPCVQMQKAAGIQNPSPEFTVYTDPNLDEQVLKHHINTPYVTIMEPTTWQLKSYVFTREEYTVGLHPSNPSYGTIHRNIANVMANIEKQIPDVQILHIGAPATDPTLSLPFNSGNRTLDLEASLIKHSMAFIGVEGGLANLAAGVGTRTILLYDFVHQLYGWHGTVKPVSPEPQLGPRYYFPDIEHIDVNPYLSDEEVGIEMGKCVLRDYSGTKTGKIFKGTGDIQQWL